MFSIGYCLSVALKDLCADELKELGQLLDALRGIPDVVSLVHGQNVSARANGFSYGLGVVFKNQQAERAYQVHELHQNLLKFTRPRSAESTPNVMDFHARELIAHKQASSSSSKGTILIVNGTGSAGKGTTIRSVIPMLNGYWVSLSSDELIEARAKEKGVTLSNAEACLELLDTARTLANGGLNVILDILVFENAVSDRLIDVLGDLSLVVALLHVPLSAYPARVKTRNDRAIACGRDNDVRFCFQTLYCYFVMFGPAAAGDDVLATLTRSDLDSTLLTVENEFSIRHGAEGPARYQAFVGGAHKLVGFASADVQSVQLHPRAKHDIVVDSFSQSPEKVAEQIASLVKARQSSPTASAFLSNKGKNLFYQR